MTRKHMLQDPTAGFLLKLRLDNLPAMRWARRMRRPRQADVFLLSYPKTGRTWVRVMLGRLLADHFGHPELARVELGDNALPRYPGVPRIHAKHDGRPENRTAAEISDDKSEYAGVKVILLVRDPRDALVSNYFQVTRRQQQFEGDISSYLRWPRGSVDSFLRHYNVWAAARRVPRGLLLLRYEDLREDTERELRRVVEFLRLQNVSEASIAAAVAHGHFDAMQQREAARPADGTAFAAGRASDPESFKTRKGKVGGYREYLSPVDVEWLNARIANELDPYYGYGPGDRPDPVRT